MDHRGTTTWDESVSRAVVEAIAEADGVEPQELTPPLYEAINTDALERLFAATSTAGRADGEVVFAYGAYEVSVEGGEKITIGEIESEDP